MSLQTWSTTKKYGFVILLFGLCLTVPDLFLKQFYSKGEPREALVGQAMLQQNNWILPSRYGEEFATKPPLMHWTMAAVGTVQGHVDEFAARFPSVLYSIIAVLLFYIFLASEVNTDKAFATCLILLTSIEWHRSSTAARVDMTLAAFSVMALIALYKWEKKNFNRLPWLGSIAMAAAVLTKGPVGLVLPLGIILFFGLTNKKPLKLLFVSGLKAFCITALFSSIWYIAAFYQGGQEFIKTIFLENVARFSGTMDQGEDPHSHGIFYLFGTVILGLLPWAILFIAAIPGYIGKLKKSPRFFGKVKDAFLNLPPFVRFAALVCISYLIFFSIPSSKRSVYLLPMYPFLCFFLVAGINRIASSTPRLIKIFTIVLAVLTLLIAVLPLLGNLLTKINLERFIHKDKQLTEAKFYVDLISQLHSQWGIIPWVLCLTLLLFSVWLMFSKNKIASGTGSILPPALLIGLCLLFVNTSVLPTITDALSAKPYALKILASTPASIEKFYSYNARYYGLNFYMNGKLEVLEEGAPIPPPALVFVEDSQAENFLKNASNLAITPFARSENPMEKPTIFLKSYLVFPKNKTILHD